MAAGGPAQMPLQFFDDLTREFDYDNKLVLNKGGTAHVSRIKKKGSGEVFALKTVYKGCSRVRNKAIKREKEALEVMDHVNIIKLFAVYEDKQDVHFLMSWMEETDLWSWVNLWHSKYGGYHGLPHENVRYYAAELTSALEYMRERGFIHRDIKAENILLTGDFHLKLTDFGTARKVIDEQGNIMKDIMNSICGTPLYLAPEILAEQPVTYSSDLWGLANVVSFMFFTVWVCQKDEDENYVEYFQRINDGDYEYPGDRRFIDLENLILRLTRRNPSVRVGATNMAQLKRHSFFKPINWETLQQTPPPNIKPEGGDHLTARREDWETVSPIARKPPTDHSTKPYDQHSIFDSPSDRRTHPEYGPLFQAHVQAAGQAQARSPGGAGRRAQAVESPHRRAIANAQQEAVNRQADRLARVNIAGSARGSARGGQDTRAPRATFETLMQGGLYDREDDDDQVYED